MLLTKPYLLLLGVAIALPTASVAAAPMHRAAAPPIVVDFNVLPGRQAQGRPVKRAFSYMLARGQSLADTVMVVNGSRTTPLTVRLSVSNVVTPPEGGGIAFDNTRRQTGLARWLHIGSSTVTVPPYSIVRVPIQLRLPSSIHAGDYEGVINAVDQAPQTVPGSKHAIGAHVYVNRQCFVQLRVSGHATAGLHIARARVAIVGKTPLLAVTVTNTGDVIDYPTLVATTLSTPHRTYAFQASRIGPLMPGSTTDLVLNLGRTSARGLLRSRVRIAYLASPGAPSAPLSLQATWSGTLVMPRG